MPEEKVVLKTKNTAKAPENMSAWLNLLYLCAAQ